MGVFDGMYDSVHMNEHRKKRLDLIVSHYGRKHFVNKSVLELGAAWGHIGAFFYNELGAAVVSTDHYDKWVDIIRERHPYLVAEVVNVNDITEGNWPFTDDFDVVLHMGLLYHQPAELAEPTLKEILKHCNEAIIESQASGAGGPLSVEKRPKPPKEHLWEEIATEYCLPSAAFVSRILDESGFEHTMNNYHGDRFMWFAKRK